jgi:hypothetical protein
MKQSVSPALMVGIIVVVVAVIGFFGYKMFLSGPASGGPRPEQAMEGRKMKDQYQNYGQSRPQMPGNVGGPGSMPTSGGR